MAYRQQLQEVPREMMVKRFEKAIDSLAERFRKHPYLFYTESDLHCYLYHRLYVPPFNAIQETSDEEKTILLHKEFPTFARYTRQKDKVLKSDPKGKRRGHFDICIWDPAVVKRHTLRKQKVLIAAELALNECHSNSVHSLNDIVKLSDKLNVKYGYLLFFARDSTDYRRNKEKIMQTLKKSASHSLRVLVVNAEEGNKPPPEKLGGWGLI